MVQQTERKGSGLPKYQALEKPTAILQMVEVALADHEIQYELFTFKSIFHVREAATQRYS